MKDHKESIVFAQSMKGVVSKVKNVGLDWTHYGLEMPSVVLIWVNIVSGNGLLPDSTKPLPVQIFIDHQWGPVAFTHDHFQWYELPK